MSMVPSLAEQIAKLDPVDREQLAHLLEGSAVNASHEATTPAVVTTVGVCGGAPRIIRTRIPIWTLERLRQRGISEADLLRSFPSLRAVDLVHAWIYVETHREEIERQIRENEED